MLAGAVLILSSDEGLQGSEVVYFVWYMVYFVYWYVSRLLLYRTPLLEGPEDYACLLYTSDAADE